MIDKFTISTYGARDSYVILVDSTVNTSLTIQGITGTEYPDKIIKELKDLIINFLEEKIDISNHKESIDILD